MERRSYGFFTKRSQHYDNLQAEQQQQQQQKQPLKDTTNTGNATLKSTKLNNNDEEPQREEPESTQTRAPTPTIGNNSNNSPHQQEVTAGRSLQCLETLAQKAGIFDITAEDCKYDAANTLLNLERGQHSASQSRHNMTELNKGGQMEQQSQQQAQQQAQQQGQQATQQAGQAQVVQQQVVQQQQMQQVQQVQMPDQHQTMVPAQSPQQHIQQISVSSGGGGQSMGPPQHTVSMHQQVAQGGQVIQTQGGQLLATGSNNTTITTMSPLQQAQTHTQQLTDWSHGRVQVIQQPMQNQTFVPQLYNAQGQQLIMPGNLLHPGLNPQQIQVITKPFQGNQLQPHMITTAQGKQVISSQGATFPGYTTIPTTQNQQTLVFSQLAIGSQPNIMTHSTAGGGNGVNQQKQQEMHKVQMQGQKVQMQKVTGNVQTVAQQQQGQCVQVSQAMLGSQPTAQIISGIQPNGQMQFAPWQFSNGIPQVWTTNGLQPQALIAPNSIFIRGTQPDGSPGPGMFIQPSAQPTIQTQQNQPAATITTQGIQQLGKPRPVTDNIQPKQSAPRPINIMPSNAQAIRPASSVSTQTGAQTQLINAKAPNKVRSKPPTNIRTSPAPKADAANQTQPKQQPQPYNQAIQQHLVNNKMLVMNTSAGMHQPGSPMTAEKAQQLAQAAANQKQVQQGQPQQVQQVIMQQQQAIQQQAMQQMQFQGQQHIQPKMMTMQAIQQPMQVQGDRPIMPVVSMSAQPTAQVQQTMQQLQGLHQGLPLQSNLAVTQQPMQMNIQQIHPQMSQMTHQQGAIIGQLHTTPGGTQQHLQQLGQPGQQTITISAAPQQIPLPASVPPVKVETGVESITADSSEAPKEAKAEPQSAEVKPLINGLEMSTNPTAAVQPTPIAGPLPVSTTNENGLPLATTTEEAKERCPPKAMVKPQVLTHVIEDFVIQESSEPFPITRSSLIGDYKHGITEKEHPEEPLRKKQAHDDLDMKSEYAKCENCGTVDLKAKFKKNKRFCSMACSKSAKHKDSKKKWEKEDAMEVDVDSAASGAESSLSPTGSSQVHDDTPRVDPLKWSVQEVFEFIKNLPGCTDYAEDFQIQEIDGQALLLLKEDHLMTAMNMKLGPALKIVAKIDDMRIDKEPPKQA